MDISRDLLASTIISEIHSTVLCSQIHKEVVSNYNFILDASQAFDRIHFGKLLATLIERNVPFCFICLILDTYTRQQSRVSWDNCVLKYFYISNGVEQGGVLSPTLFSIYIDKLLLKLKELGYGCHFNGIYMGVLAYADNITITCPSRHGLHKILVWK